MTTAVLGEIFFTFKSQVRNFEKIKAVPFDERSRNPIHLFVHLSFIDSELLKISGNINGKLSDLTSELRISKVKSHLLW